MQEQLLTLLAQQNDGLVEFLGDDELEDRITDFYLRIRNPVLLGAEVTFDPPQVSQVNPDPLPGLYKGQQVVVAGRYQEPGSVTVQLAAAPLASRSPTRMSFRLPVNRLSATSS